MVRRVLTMMYKEVRGLHQAAYVLALFAFGSQLLALVRDRLLAHQFGAGYELDMYYAAFRIPDLLYVLFASTLSVYVLIPFITRAETHENSEAAKHILAQVFTLFCIFYAVLAVFVCIYAPQLVSIFFPAFAGETTIVTLLRILLLQPFFLGISSLFGVITQMGHRFVLFAISPLIYNLGIIFGIIALYPVFGLSGIAYGVVLGAIGHMLIQWPLVQKSSLSFGFTTHISISQIKAILSVSIPRALTLSLGQVTFLVFVSIASTMSAGSVSVYQFAYNLQSVPLAVIGASYSVAAFPMLARLFAQNEMEKFGLYISSALRHIIFWSLPVIALVVVLRAQLVRVVLGSGAFDWSDTRLTAAVLALLAVSLLAQAVSLVATRAFYAGGHTRIPFVGASIGMVTALCFALVFKYWYLASVGFQEWITTLMRVESVIGSEVLVLGAAYTCGMLVQATLLLGMVLYTYQLQFRWWLHVLRASFAAIVGGFSAYAALQLMVQLVDIDTFIGIFVQGFVGGIVGLLATIFAYFIVRSPELEEVSASFKRKIFKTEIAASDQEII